MRAGLTSKDQSTLCSPTCGARPRMVVVVRSDEGDDGDGERRGTDTRGSSP